jgi:hypothetical protein
MPLAQVLSLICKIGKYRFNPFSPKEEVLIKELAWIALVFLEDFFSAKNRFTDFRPETRLLPLFPQVKNKAVMQVG